MRKILNSTGSLIARPIRAGHRAAHTNARLWRHTFWEAWEPLPLDIKLTWIVFVGQTIGILTLVELCFLKKITI